MFALDTPIMAVAPLRWTTVGALEEGDLLVDEAGARTAVLRVSEPVLPETMYRVQFGSGEEFRVGGTHRWVTWTVDERLALTDGWPEDWAARGTSRTTDEIYRTRSKVHAVGKAARLDLGGWHQIVNIEEVAPEVSRAVVCERLYLVGESWIASR